jgi:histone-arginine methyltransferase CARM1
MSRFEERKDKEAEGDTNPFTMFYGQLLHQGNMLQDHVRTGRYQQAIFDNAIDFRGKVVLDVGTGTGILAFFAAQAGAKKVYAVELSDAANIAETLAKSNGFSDVVQVVRGKIEEITLPEKVDMIISEPLGFLLVHERMLESYVTARDRFLKPRGKMFPTTGDIVFGPITDQAMHDEQAAKAAFWNNNNFFNIDLTAVMEEAYAEFFTQAIVGFFPSSALLSSTRTVHKVDFLRVSTEELKRFEIPFSFKFDKTAVMHGFGCWFDVNFIGSAVNIELSTGPDHPGTHWYQVSLNYYA